MPAVSASATSESVLAFCYCLRRRLRFLSPAPTPPRGVACCALRRRLLVECLFDGHLPQRVPRAAQCHRGMRERAMSQLVPDTPKDAAAGHEWALWCGVRRWPGDCMCALNDVLRVCWSACALRHQMSVFNPDVLAYFMVVVSSIPYISFVGTLISEAIHEGPWRMSHVTISQVSVSICKARRRSILNVPRRGSVDVWRHVSCKPRQTRELRQNDACSCSSI